MLGWADSLQGESLCTVDCICDLQVPRPKNRNPSPLVRRRSSTDPLSLSTALCISTPYSVRRTLEGGARLISSFVLRYYSLLIPSAFIAPFGSILDCASS